jgi:hypothetical protein
MKTLVSDGRKCVGLFRVKGRPCAGFVNPVPFGYPHPSSIDGKEVYTGRRLFHLPFGKQDWDWCDISVSPDGRYLALHSGVSAVAVNFIATVKNAGLLFKELDRAILCQWTQEDAYTVAWSPSQLGNQYPVALVNPSDTEQPMALGLTDGNREHRVLMLADLTYLAWWKSTDKEAKYLAVVGDELTTLDEAFRSNPLLRHKPEAF